MPLCFRLTRIHQRSGRARTVCKALHSYPLLLLGSLLEYDYQYRIGRQSNSLGRSRPGKCLEDMARRVQLEQYW